MSKSNQFDIMTEEDLKNYLNNNSNFGALQRVLQNRNAPLLKKIKESWIYDYSPKSFLEIVYRYFHKDINIVCPYGNVMFFEYYRTGYKCKKSCKCRSDLRSATMIKRYGVPHPMQSTEIQTKFKTTLYERYGVSTLSSINQDKAKETNMKKYGVQYPLESCEVRKKGNITFKDRTGFNNPFDMINDNKERYTEKAIQTRKINHPPKHSDNVVKEHLEKFSYRKTSDMLGLYMPYLKSVVVRNKWDDLLPKKSSYEIEIGRILEENNIEYIANSRSIIPPLELDFYCPDQHLAIEFNGLRWHTEHFGKKDKNYHLRKYDLCKEKGIKLIHIFEDEWLDYRDIITKIITKEPSCRVFARKCVIKSITSAEAYSFCQKRHLQGGTRVKFNYGLFYDDSLISVMTFRRLRKKEYELSRYCIDIDYHIIAGAEKLFAKFVKEVDFEVIITYSDKRYFDGSVYNRLEFNHEGDTTPNYWYVVNGKRVHRLQFTKKKLVKQGHSKDVTEWEIMKKIGIDRIWDCGSSRWKFIKDNIV